MHPYVSNPNYGNHYMPPEQPVDVPVTGFAEDDGAPTVFVGFCDECRSVKCFSSDESRKGWEKFHPHQEV